MSGVVFFGWGVVAGTFWQLFGNAMHFVLSLAMQTNKPLTWYLRVALQDEIDFVLYLIQRKFCMVV